MQSRQDKMILPGRKTRRGVAFACMLGMIQCNWRSVSSFLPTTNVVRPASTPSFELTKNEIRQVPTTTTSYATLSTARNVWWYGGNENVEKANYENADSCELVAVRIEKTSANSRKIFGEITVPNARLQDVWAILTDYNRLSTHVPNLVESHIERPLSGGEMGDGQYECRLFQKGAQKIVGFEFGASVTMDMKEVVTTVPANDVEERKITFKCHDSFFFREFDGDWKVQERTNELTGETECLLSYVVDVRPRGPVPVAALEWRIREDVPTNLRAVKKAAMQVGYEGVMATRRGQRRVLSAASEHAKQKAASAASSLNGVRDSALALARDAKAKVQWYKDETMAAYLTD